VVSSLAVVLLGASCEKGGGLSFSTATGQAGCRAACGEKDATVDRRDCYGKGRKKQVSDLLLQPMCFSKKTVWLDSHQISTIIWAGEIWSRGTRSDLKGRSLPYCSSKCSRKRKNHTLKRFEHARGKVWEQRSSKAIAREVWNVREHFGWRRGECVPALKK